MKKFLIELDSSMGSGSHACFTEKDQSGNPQKYPIPKGKEIDKVYVKGVRRRFQLTDEFGVSDEDFYEGLNPS